MSTPIYMEPYMTKQEVVKAYGTELAVAKLLRITRQAVSRWRGEPPPLRQAQLHQISGGMLKISKSAKSKLKAMGAIF